MCRGVLAWSGGPCWQPVRGAVGVEKDVEQRGPGRVDFLLITDEGVVGMFAPSHIEHLGWP